MSSRPAAPTMKDVLASSRPDDWRSPDPENVLYLELASGRVVFELAPAFAPAHVANVKALAREGYFDGLTIVRVQDNYVVQWGDPEAQRPIRSAQRTLPPEFERAAAGLELTLLPDPDTYAPEVGFAQGFPAARDAASGKAWLVHCYGMLGAGRDNAPDSGGGAELYVVIGHAPRQLDRNVTLLGRVLSGIELLSVLPRGTEALGFYGKPEQRVPIQRVRVAADVAPAERTELEVLRTDTPTFQALVESRRNRREEWFQYAAGRIELCNVPVAVRPKAR
jgi:peptidylprolyl isomerase